jgi:peptidoglycan L-alanyl-D-glutamate endopeptidase CwlK
VSKVNKFSERSKKNLSECHPDLQAVAVEAIKIIDFAVLEGHRPREEQEKAFHKGLSKVQWPESNHNKKPSEAMDIAPYPIDWNNKERFYYLAGIIMGIAHAKGIELRYGGDWDRDGDITDQNFMDLVHFERVFNDDNTI